MSVDVGWDATVHTCPEDSQARRDSVRLGFLGLPWVHSPWPLPAVDSVAVRSLPPHAVVACAVWVVWYSSKVLLLLRAGLVFL